MNVTETLQLNKRVKKMKNIKLVILLSILGFASMSFAECNVNLNAEDLVECIVDEGADGEGNSKHSNNASESKNDK